MVWSGTCLCVSWVLKLVHHVMVFFLGASSKSLCEFGTDVPTLGYQCLRTMGWSSVSW